VASTPSPQARQGRLHLEQAGPGPVLRVLQAFRGRVRLERVDDRAADVGDAPVVLANPYELSGE